MSEASHLITDLVWIPILLIGGAVALRWANAWLDRPQKPPRVNASDDTQ
jgi:hypothetical protein